LIDGALRHISKRTLKFSFLLILPRYPRFLQDKFAPPAKPRPARDMNLAQKKRPFVTIA
jgi:hypothetical protein